MIALESIKVTELTRLPGDAPCGGPAAPRPPVYVADIRLWGLTESDVEELRALVGEHLSVSRAERGGL